MTGCCPDGVYNATNGGTDAGVDCHSLPIHIPSKCERCTDFYIYPPVYEGVALPFFKWRCSPCPVHIGCIFNSLNGPLRPPFPRIVAATASRLYGLSYILSQPMSRLPTKLSVYLHFYSVSMKRVQEASRLSSAFLTLTRCSREMQWKMMVIYPPLQCTA